MKSSLLPLLLIAIVFFSACGDDEDVDTTLPDQIVGTWVQTRFVIDCADDEEDESIDIVCDELNCRQITFGADSTFVTVNTAEGNPLTVEEFYLFTVDVLTGETENSIEICESVDFNRECTRNFDVSIDGNTLMLTSTDEENCVNTREYIRSSQ
ncbi:MAG: hypothetical protein WBA74_01465 [Cyclobacteriaceae bacterium]